MFSEEGFVNLEYLEKFTQEKYPLDIKCAMDNLKGKIFEIVATDMANGNPVYLQPTMDKWLLYLRASATLPFFSRGVCNVNGRQLMDGGWSDAIPVQRGIKKGAKKLVVIRTLPKDHKENFNLDHSNTAPIEDLVNVTSVSKTRESTNESHQLQVSERRISKSRSPSVKVRRSSDL